MHNLPQLNQIKGFKCDKCGKYQGGNPKINCICESPQFRAISRGKEQELFHTQWLTEAYRVLKPGGSMLVMGGTRTFHRLACAIEDTGFIIKDCLMWIYGSGFPKAQDLGKMIDKRAGKEREIIGEVVEHDLDRKGKIKGDMLVGKQTNVAPHSITIPTTDLAKHWDGFKIGGIKPAYEPIIWAVKPPEGSYVDNVLKWGVGAVNVDECRTSLNGERQPSGSAKRIYKSNQYTEDKIYGDNKITPNKGRFPANIILDEESAKTMGEVSRFFYTPKASRSERGEGIISILQLSL